MRCAHPGTVASAVQRRNSASPWSGPRPSVLGMDAPLAATPATIVWDQVNGDGTKSATLVGTRDRGVMFSYAFFIPAGFYDRPHHHCAAAHLQVASGTLRLGYGTSFELDRTTVHPAGSFLYVPAGAVHFDGAEEDTVLIGTATGPWDTVYVA